MKRILALFLCLAAWSPVAAGEKPVECTTSPPIVVWKPWAPSTVRLTVRVRDRELVGFCVGWGDGDHFCRDVDEYPYTEVFSHVYRSCDPNTTILVNFGKRDGTDVKPVRTERLLMSFHCG